MESNFFIDIHCHSSIKAFARSFKDHPGQQSADPGHPSSIWRADAPSLFDKLKNYIATLTNFIQSDASSLIRGRVSVVCLSFYPQEKGFFVNKLGTGNLSDALSALATEFGHERIDHLQALQSYWDDLMLEMNFMVQQENKPVNIDGRMVSYRIARSYADIDLAERAGELGESSIVFVPSIEGAHVFDQLINSNGEWSRYPETVSEEGVNRALSRIKQLRAAEEGLLRPVFITLAHHFWNGLCGQARSLGGLVKCIIDQENGLGTGFTEAGRKVVRAMLGEMTDGNGVALPPIYIDIKHMSYQSRQDYYQLLEEEFSQSNIMLIVSHGGVTGLPAPGGHPLTPAAMEGLYMTDPINFYDEELVRIDISGGIFGIQLDERRIGSKQALRKARFNLSRRDILYAWSRLVWNQVRHMAEVLDAAGRFSWGIQSVGTDFDGIIDPINGYWTSRSLDDLDDYLLKHAFDYIKGIKSPCPLQQARNRALSAEEIVERVMTGNALNFLSKAF